MDYNELENSFEFLDNLEEMRTTVREMEELRKSMIEVELTDLNSQALRSQMLQTVNGSLMNFKTLLKISEMVVGRVQEDLEDE
tara:strand:- start:907 stop:1155 length:249 start_codon:yes stop_codon:yes gene_type:complete